MKYAVLLIFILIIAGFKTGNAQVLNVTVTVQYDHLPTDEQDDLADFGDKVEQYFNGYTWVEDDYEYDVNCSVRIIIETVQKKTFEKKYKAQFLISSASGEVFYDKTWEFPYEKSYPLSHVKAQFDPVTHFLDFYAYLILAGELDTNGLFLGTPLYSKAAEIANQALLSRYPQGWNQRLQVVQMITNVRTRPLRQIKPDFFEALFQLDQENYKSAYQLGMKVLTGLEKVHNAEPNNRYLQMFFNSHYRDLGKLFRGHNAELQKLVEWDSKHRASYRDMMDTE